MMQMFRLSSGVASDAVHIAVGRHGEMYLFHRRPFSLGVLVASAAIPKFNVIEQGLEPLERSRCGRHLRARRSRNVINLQLLWNYAEPKLQRCAPYL